MSNANRRIAVITGSSRGIGAAIADDAVFDSQIAIDLKGTFNTLRKAWRRLRANGGII